MSATPTTLKIRSLLFFLITPLFHHLLILSVFIPRTTNFFFSTNFLEIYSNPHHVSLSQSMHFHVFYSFPMIFSIPYFLNYLTPTFFQGIPVDIRLFFPLLFWAGICLFLCLIAYFMSNPKPQISLA